LKGHVAVSILMTVTCNVVGIFTIPLYVKWMVSSGVSVKFDVADMMLKLFGTLFVPLVVGLL